MKNKIMPGINNSCVTNIILIYLFLDLQETLWVNEIVFNIVSILNIVGE